jgi:hypothetical protein
MGADFGARFEDFRQTEADCGRDSCLPPLFIQTFPTAPQSSDKNPAPLAEHLNPLTENQFFT